MGKYYDYSELLSHNGVFNFVVGGRGIGKTYGAKIRAIKDFLKKGDQFIYLRRYQTELGPARDTFMADIEYEFPDHDFKIHGNKLYLSDHMDIDQFENESEFNRMAKGREWHHVGYFIALSTAQKQKSVAFPKVKTIIFDEFIIEKGHVQYIPDEHIVLTNFYSTVDRYKDKTKVLFLANSVSIMNPYFIAYDIVPDQEKRFVKRSKGFIVADFPDSEEFQNAIYETRFGAFIKDTDYAEYAVGNQFKDNDNALIEIKGYKARYKFTLECKTGTFSVWYSSMNNNFYIQDKLPGDQLVYTLVPEKMTVDKTLMSVRDKPIAYLRAAFNNGRMLFDKPSTRNTFREVFKR